MAQVPNDELLRAQEEALGFVTEVINAVPVEAWTNQSPCPEWTVHDVANHLTGENLWAGPLMEGSTVAEVGDRFDGDLLGSDPQTAWKHAGEVAFIAFRGPEAMERIVHVSFGDIPASMYLTQMTTDLIIHGWDIAKGSSQEAMIPPQLVEVGLQLLEDTAEDARKAGVFGDEVPAGEDAGPQTRMLAMAGRRG